MADTVDLDAITEYFDEPDVVRAKVARLAGWISAARHVTAFTGAGISTAADIPDYRGPEGVWTRKAQGRAGPRSIRMEQAIPTFSHMALATLTQSGKLAFLTSQNVDGLHLRSGVPPERIAELHGNTYLEVCWRCDARALRTFSVSERVNGSGRCGECAKRVPHFCHCTSRACTACGAAMKDSIIHFGENLPEADLEAAFDHARRSDLCIVLGSSLRVTPACHVPRETKRAGGKLVIVNLQATPYDERADMVIHARIDQVMRALCDTLAVRVAPFELSQAIIDEAARLGVPPPYTAVEAVAKAARDAAAVERIAHQRAPLEICVSNTARRVPSPAASAEDRHQWHKWTFRVEPSVADTIDAVHVTLHPSFAEPHVALREPPFELSRVGWGTFKIGVRVEFNPALALAPVVTTHELSFDAGGASATHVAVPAGV